ncbi:unnamed protein product [Psylliodes chrysocephalus]|uniref:Ubiquitin-like protease family profile domain-containing protein n=1 Tax=Psylliodes chrysocephalus TaxID=3402493 RepID=A0A9P0GEL9_9CUCU|nr:unnamed protein product [Psylliodes chrysocephala]
MPKPPRKRKEKNNDDCLKLKKPKKVTKPELGDINDTPTVEESWYKGPDSCRKKKNKYFTIAKEMRSADYEDSEDDKMKKSLQEEDVNTQDQDNEYDRMDTSLDEENINTQDEINENGKTKTSQDEDDINKRARSDFFVELREDVTAIKEFVIDSYKLTNIDLSTLRKFEKGINPKELWLTDNIINGFASMEVSIARKNARNIENLDSILTFAMMNSKKRSPVDYNSFLNPTVMKFRWWLIPLFVNENHWTLAFADRAKKNLVYLDSNTMSRDKSTKVLLPNHKHNQILRMRRKHLINNGLYMHLETHLNKKTSITAESMFVYGYI